MNSCRIFVHPVHGEPDELLTRPFGWLKGSVITPITFVLASGFLQALLLLFWLALVVVIRIVEGLLINVEAGGLPSSCAGGMPHSIFFFLRTFHCRCQLHPSHVRTARQCVLLEPGFAAADQRSKPLFGVPLRQKMPFLIPFVRFVLVAPCACNRGKDCWTILAKQYLFSLLFLALKSWNTRVYLSSLLQSYHLSASWLEGVLETISKVIDCTRSDRIVTGSELQGDGSELYRAWPTH